MVVKLIREIDHCNSERTVGNLYVDDKPFCSTIEPPLRGNATHPKGAIPKGWYKISVTYSPKFKRVMPLLYMVPGFKGIRIHAGLSVNNTSGCICVGVRANENRLTELLTQVQARNEEIFINITDSDSVRELREYEEQHRNTVGY